MRSALAISLLFQCSLAQLLVVREWAVTPLTASPMVPEVPTKFLLPRISGSYVHRDCGRRLGFLFPWPFGLLFVRVSYCVNSGSSDSSSGFSLLILQNHTMSLLPSLRATHLVFRPPQTFVRTDLLLQVGPHFSEVTQEKFPGCLTQTNRLEFSHRSLKQRFELTPRQLALNKRGVFAIYSDLTFFSALREHQVLRLDPSIDSCRVLKNFSGLPSGLIDVPIGLQTASPATSSQSHQHLTMCHAPAIVSQSADVLKVLVELVDVFGI